MPPVALSRSGLRRLVGRAPEAQALVTSLVEALGGPVAVEDAAGVLLHGEPVTGGDRIEMRRGDEHLGFVHGGRSARVLAALLGHLASRENETKALGAEVLHLYREINLIYSFSEKLAAELDLERVARLTLQEARQMIVATDGVVMLLDQTSDALVTVAGFGDEMPTLSGYTRGIGIVGAVAASGIGEVVNDTSADPRRVRTQTTIAALICAPMKVGEQVIGVIALGSTAPITYTAADLKLVNTLALQAATAIENARLFERTLQAAREREQLLALHQAAELARAKLESEMTLAARIQKDLFPQSLPQPEGYELAARSLPARRCGGDYYDALELDGKLLLCVADVSGKGMPAALLMSHMQATLRALAGRTPSISALASQASELLYAATSPEKYVTAAVAELMPASGQLQFAGAGHLDNLILCADGAISALASTGAPLGLLPPGLPYGETSAGLGPGDALLLFSDGVTDAQNAEGDEFGETRLHAVLREVAGQPAAAIIERVFGAVDAFAAGHPQFDDMTILVLRRA
jgi:sigma-B regulation protein RsbU (phosphoserine phosphatase)